MIFFGSYYSMSFWWIIIIQRLGNQLFRELSNRCHQAAHIWCCCKAGCLCTSTGCSNPVHPSEKKPHFDVSMIPCSQTQQCFLWELLVSTRSKTIKTTHASGKKTTLRSPRRSAVLASVARSFRIIHLGTAEIFTRRPKRPKKIRLAQARV